MCHLHYRRHILVSLLLGLVTTLFVVALLRVVWNLDGGVVYPMEYMAQCYF
jgi:hypothetical protein